MTTTFSTFMLYWSNFGRGASAMRYDEATSRIEFEQQDWKKIVDLYQGSKPSFGPPSDFSEIYPRNVFLPELDDVQYTGVSAQTVKNETVVKEKEYQERLQVHHIIPRTWINHKLEKAVQTMKNEKPDASFWYTISC